MSDLGPTVSFERVPKTEWLIAPRPEDRASGPPKSSANHRRGRKDAGVNPFPFPLCIGMIIAQGKPVSGFGLAKYPEYKN